jgi:hypothetical protein
VAAHIPIRLGYWGSSGAAVAIAAASAENHARGIDRQGSYGVCSRVMRERPSLCNNREAARRAYVRALGHGRRIGGPDPASGRPAGTPRSPKEQIRFVVRGAGRERWNPTSREKRARCGAPGDSCGARVKSAFLAPSTCHRQASLLKSETWATHSIFRPRPFHLLRLAKARRHSGLSY